jgi:ribosome maturation factor RimP
MVTQQSKIVVYLHRIETKREGTLVVPSFIAGMSDTIEKTYALLEPLLDGTDIFIVNIKVKPTNNIKVFLDADSGFSIQMASSVNRKLYAGIEASGMFPDGDFSLEVSSPGIDEPLGQVRQYRKNIGRKVTVTDNEDKEVTGMMTAVTDEHITLEVKGKKPKDPLVVAEIPFTNIKKTIVQIIF